MSNGILQSLPDTSSIEQAQGLIQGQLGQTLTDLTEEPATFVEPLLQTLSPVGEAMPSDGSAWTGSISTLLDDVESLIPDNIDDLTGSLMGDLNAIQPLVEESPIGEMLSDLRSGRTFTEIATEQLEDATGGALGQLTEQIGGVLSSERLTEATDFINTLAELSSSPPTEADQLVGLISEDFLGVPRNLLSGAAAISNQRLDAIIDLQQTIGPAIDTLQTELSNRLMAATAHLGTFDPAQEAAYQTLIDLLNQSNQSVTGLIEALDDVPTVLSQGLQDLDLEDWGSQLESALESLPRLDVSALHQVADQLLQRISQLSDLLQNADPAQLVGYVHNLLNAIIDAFDTAITALTDNPVFDFFDELREKVQVLDIQEIEEGLNDILNSIRSVIDAFDTQAIVDTVEAALGAIETALDAIDIEGAITSCVALLQEISDSITAIPITDVTGAIDAALATVEGLLSDLESGSQVTLEQINSVLTALEDLSFYPLAEPVIEAINAIKDLVEGFDLSILPSSMADELRQACQDFKDSFDPSAAQYFDENVIQFLNEEFTQVEAPLREAMETVEEKLAVLAERITSLEPSEWLEPIAEAIQEVSEALGEFSGGDLIGPVETARQELLATLGEFSPEDLFAPVEQAYEEVLGQLQDFTPGDLLQPLIELYQAVDEMIQMLDIGEHLEGLSETSTAMFDSAHGQLMDALDLSSLPDELGDLSGQVQPLLNLLSPGTTPDQAASIFQTFFEDLKPGDLFEPLQDPYEQLLGLLDDLQADLLVDAFEELQAQLVTNLERVDPGVVPSLLQEQLGALGDTLEAHLPQAVAGGLESSYQGLLTAFQTIDAEAVPDTLQPLYQQAQTLVESLNPATRVGDLQDAFEALGDQVESVGEALDLSSASSAFARVGTKLGDLVPEFLSDELTVDTIREGMAALSPSALGARVNEPFDQLYADIQALTPALQSEYEAFLDTLGDKLLELSPFIIFDKFREIYQAIVDQLLFIDPQALADALNDDVYAPLLSKFETLHPCHIREAVQETFDQVVGKIEALDLEAVTTAIDGALGTIRGALADLEAVADPEALRTLFVQISDTLTDLAIVQVFEQLVDAFARLRDDLDRTLTVSGTAFDDMITALPS